MNNYIKPRKRPYIIHHFKNSVYKADFANKNVIVIEHLASSSKSSFKARVSQIIQKWISENKWIMNLKNFVYLFFLIHFQMIRHYSFSNNVSRKKINNFPKKNPKIQETYTPKFSVWFVYFNKMVNLKKALQSSCFDTFLCTE